VAVPDSGFFLDYVDVRTNTSFYTKGIQNLMELSNVEVDPIVHECVKDLSDEKWKCFFAEHLINYIKVPLFYIQSEYDSWSLSNILGENCHSPGNLSTCTPK